jgi:2-oxoisovalerate dehydrogenase E1 component
MSQFLANISEQTLSAISDDELKRLYVELLKPRLFEERMLTLLRQGRISKWFAGIGQEAVGVGVASALHSNEYILPIHRCTSVMLARGIPVKRLMSQFLGKNEGFTQGRDRSFYFGSKDHLVIGGISQLGAQLPVACGIALGEQLKQRAKVCVVFCGDGGSSQGDVHEAMNLASVWNLPVIFLIENNQYGLSTPVHEQYACESLADRAIGYGMEGMCVDGNNILEVYQAISDFARSARENPRPILLECLTFRMRGHEEASGTAYVPPEMFEYWKKRDPIDTYAQHLIDAGLLSVPGEQAVREAVAHEIEEQIEEAYLDSDVVSTSEIESKAIYAPFEQVPKAPATAALKEMRFVDAISDGLRLGMREHENLVLMGQDVAEYGGVFKITEGFLEEFGKDRIRNTPLCESAIAGMCVGLSITNYKSIFELQFADFAGCAFNQIVNNIAKLHYRWGQNVDTLIRLPVGAGVRAGPFHSMSNEAWFASVPGLKIVYPSSVRDAKGLVLAALEDPNPVLFFEHKVLYRRLKEEIPEDYFTEEIGKAKLVSEGSDVSIITWGMGVHWAQEYSAKHPELSVAILDLRTLRPYDEESIAEVVEMSGRVLVLHEAALTAGFGAEIAAFIAENLFQHLDAPVVRCGSLDTPIPFAASLEDSYLANARLEDKLQSLLNF